MKAGLKTNPTYLPAGPRPNINWSLIKAYNTTKDHTDNYNKFFFEKAEQERCNMKLARPSQDEWYKDLNKSVSNVSVKMPNLKEYHISLSRHNDLPPFNLW